MSRPRSLFVTAIAAALMLLPLVAAPVGATSLSVVDSSGTVITATLNGYPIPPGQVSMHDCHTRDWPIVRCFDSEAAVDADLGIASASGTTITMTTDTSTSTVTADGTVSPNFPSGVPYTVAYWDINFGGASLTIYANLSDLTQLGWNDAISSVKSLNCGVPKYFYDSNYQGIYFQVGCNAQFANIGSSNDQFSSVKNVAP